MNYDPIIYNDHSDMSRLNVLLDQLTEKPFLSPTVAINTVRAALDLHGIALPKLDAETQIEGPNSFGALSYLMAGKPVAQAAINVEYLFKIIDADHEDDIKAGKVGREDWDNYLYLYLVLDRNPELGVYEMYAQIVDADDVDALIYDDIPSELAALHPEYMDDEDVNGESPYLTTVRRSGTGSGMGGAEV